MGMEAIKLMTWNLLQVGRARIERIHLIAKRIQHHNPDVLVLTEYQTTDRGEILRTQLKEGGWEFQTASNSDAIKLGVLIASRFPFDHVPIAMENNQASQRLLCVDFGNFGLTGVYMPQKEHKQPFWDFFQAEAERRKDQRHIFLGDFNTGVHGIDEKGATFICSDAIADLADKGWHDAWRHQYPESREGTWVHSPSQNWFRIDHAFLSPSLLNDLKEASLSHEERLGKKRVSDHSVLCFSLDPTHWN